MSPGSTDSVHTKEQDLESPVDKKYDEDEEFGGHDARRHLERNLVRKLDFRMSILIVIYILNYVRCSLPFASVCADSYSDRP